MYSNFDTNLYSEDFSRNFQDYEDEMDLYEEDYSEGVESFQSYIDSYVSRCGIGWRFRTVLDIKKKIELFLNL